MRENSNDPASKNLPLPDIPTLVHSCLERGTFVQNVHNAPTAEHLNIHNQFLYLV